MDDQRHIDTGRIGRLKVGFLPLDDGWICSYKDVAGVDNMRGPILSVMEFGADRGVERYVPLKSSSELMALWSRFIWHHHDLCLFHQAIYKQIDARNTYLHQFVADNKEILSATLPDGLNMIAQARMRDTVHVLDMEKESIRIFGDQLLMIGLWAMVEQYCGRTLSEMERCLRRGHVQKETPHRWSSLADRFIGLGVDLVRCKSYVAVDECRVLNNKIKHVGRVDKQLAQFSRFENQLGKNFDTVALDLQYYSDSVMEFVTCVMERSDDVLFESGQGLEEQLD
ncbi:hypothetical protein ACFKHW_29720 [Bradyrhizobium lupini]|uniref:hypothetical protein n=1 Tax=Rhizobium lupini TaxID=136996 RepID=UPI0036711DFC